MRSSTSVAQAVAAVLAGCAIAMISAAPVWAAQSGEKGESGQVIEEVIVTVERIEQNLQSYEGTAVVMRRSRTASRVIATACANAGWRWTRS